MFRRTSAVDGKTYAIGFEMRLPVAWNGRFFHQGNGGIDGSVVTATGSVRRRAARPARCAGLRGAQLRRRPHTARSAPAFGIDPQARLDYGYQAVGKLTPMAKQRDPPRPTARGPTARTSAAARTAGATRWSPRRAMPTSTTASSPARPASTCRWRRWPTSSARSATPRVATATRHAGRPRPPPSPPPSARRWPTRCSRGATRSTARPTAWSRTRAACQRRLRPQRDVPTCTGARDGSCLSTGAEDRDRADLQRRRPRAHGAAFYASFPFDSGIGGGGIAVLGVHRAVGARLGRRRRDLQGAAVASPALINGPASRSALDIDAAAGRASSPPTPPTPNRR